MLVVGLTGGIGCGKSTVSKRLAENHDIPVIDADKIAREVVEPGQDAYNKIVKYFTDKIDYLLLDDGHLNRAELGKWVFSHPNDLKILNNITHPAVRYSIFKNMGYYYVKGYRLVILDVPLLFEAKLDMFCGVTISVICERDIQIERLKIRNPVMTTEEIENRINSQMSMDERVKKSDYILQNNGTLTELYEQINNVVMKIKPSLMRTSIEYFPLFGLVSATAIVLSKVIYAKFDANFSESGENDKKKGKKVA
ncbi:putative dephospho-CoA kinase NDAI_0C04700 [Naumovozyma dairenensis CBS 421]|uniref:Dephospho-CoA kinase n=1 Tax=Naumovozyma dairenensis (strain ATCC 10597 / BCRC 20456 / CBS 421 / NBRC 0211 / NRRL Y-12639) TaxID=1071378 RepID=G0W8L8_NAUDC|nr:hypothetical protein NDAI_0C04700 [Naumovozyma dairenensis CBS 421]CCD24129.1 hypothetical protein NDAI_0C04700 [Naumovozyma dairenensis CBS 421]